MSSKIPKTPIWVGLDSFNLILSHLKNRIIYGQPGDDIKSWQGYIWSDNQQNYHLIGRFTIPKVKDKQGNILSTEFKYRHFAIDGYEKDANLHELNKHILYGKRAMNTVRKCAKLFNEEIDCPFNKQYEDCKVLMLEWYDDTKAFKWNKHCYGYDMNSCFPYFFTKPLPYGNVIDTNRYVKEDEIGFNIIDNEVERELRAVFKGKAQLIFKTKIYKSLTAYAKNGYIIKTMNKEFKQEYNALNGVLKYHNIFIRAAVIGYAANYLMSLADKNTIMITVDSIVSTVKRTDIKLGTNLGEFKEEHIDSDFYYETCHVKEWLGNNPKLSYSGFKDSRRIDDEYYYIDGLYTYDFNKNKLIYNKERTIGKLRWQRPEM